MSYIGEYIYILQRERLSLIGKTSDGKWIWYTPCIHIHTHELLFDDIFRVTNCKWRAGKAAE